MFEGPGSLHRPFCSDAILLYCFRRFFPVRCSSPCPFPRVLPSETATLASVLACNRAHIRVRFLAVFEIVCCFFLGPPPPGGSRGRSGRPFFFGDRGFRSGFGPDPWINFVLNLHCGPKCSRGRGLREPGIVSLRIDRATVPQSLLFLTVVPHVRRFGRLVSKLAFLW